jgi:hypothetical protein
MSSTADRSFAVYRLLARFAGHRAFALTGECRMEDLMQKANRLPRPSHSANLVVRVRRKLTKTSRSSRKETKKEQSKPEFSPYILEWIDEEDYSYMTDFSSD